MRPRPLGGSPLTVVRAIVLGVIQGSTEFLPISSSGHLVVAPALLGWPQPSLTFDITLHVGTLAAVVTAFRVDLWRLLRGVLGRSPDPARDRGIVWLLLIGSIPAAVAGIALGNVFEDLFDEPVPVCAFWVVTALILLVTERLVEHRRLGAPIDRRRALTIGGAQAVAIIPGISRSGSTIAAGILTGVSREDAARFSFLLSIPAIMGAALVKVPDVVDGRFHLTGAVAAGFLSAAVVGYVSINGFLRFLRAHSLRVFALYLLIVAPLSALVVELR